MSRNLIIAAIVVVFLLFLGGAAWVYFGVLAEDTPTTQPSDGDGEDPLPFGEPSGERPTDGQGTSTQPQPTAQEAPTFWQVSEAPVAGATFVENATSTHIRYIQRAQGHIYRAETETTRTRRISNTTIPEIQSVAWAPNDSFFVARYLSESGTSVRTFSGHVASGTTEGSFLRQDVTDVAVSPDSERVLQLQRRDGGVRAVATDADGSNPVAILQQQLPRWDVNWHTDNELILQTQGGADVPAAAFAYDLDTSALRQIVSPQSGLSVSPGPNGRYLVYTTSQDDGDMPLHVLDRETGEQQELPLQTFADKCTWAAGPPVRAYCAVPESMPQGPLPDTWYQGVTFTSDTLWRINPESGDAQYLYDISEQARQSDGIDAINLDVTADGTHLIVQNKRDLSLWALDLTSI